MPKLVCTQICVLSDGVCAYVGATKSGSRYSAIFAPQKRYTRCWLLARQRGVRDVDSNNQREINVGESATTCRHSHEDAKRGEEDIVARYHETVVQSSAGPSRVGPEAEHGADQHAIFVQ